MQEEQTPKRILELAEKWVDGTITPEEQKEYAEWYNQAHDAPLVIPSSVASSQHEHAARILAKINQERRIQTPIRRLWPARIAAAAVIIVLGTASYFIFFRNNRAQVQDDRPLMARQNDLPPGGNKAVLTLADGTVVTLDSAKNGALTVQGNTQVIKGDGTVAYDQQQQLGAIQLPVYNTMTTPKGGQYQLTLADGTRVWLNAASSIRFPTAFTGNERRVEITGEAYFEVKHNAKQPFRVQLPNGSVIEDIGTSFNVNAYNDEADIRATLVEGAVRVLSADANRPEGVNLKPGQQAVISDHSPLTIDYSPNLNQILAWKTGYFSFDNSDIKTVMRQLARWYDVDVVYEGDIPNEKLDGKIPRNVNASSVLAALQYTGIKFKIEGNKILVMK